eukprot:CAMPEP_0173434952 /NCGR_PEP_ID=MMETSP1357-20121228/13855_1 /TAXON_ID=77926 /ORGANISM="Hemiselmis rufescens, Strain PCC563" /LENGTH=90 /DNA_ID=CAMNT_0014399873 /DNA_START=231 /DNA_END=499 /DNA_ORIENTATION=-
MKVFSAIRMSDCPGGVFGNDNGNLACEDLPAGTYQRTCRSCNKDDQGMLHCNCEGSPPAEASSIRADSCKRFINAGGYLGCEPGYESEGG